MARTDAPPRTDVASALERLASALRDTQLTLPTPLAADSECTRVQLVEQLEDYLLPRLRQMEAPLLMVVGGSTGAGKSTLVNSLVGEDVTASGVLRPTTRSPVLACHPDDLHWFDDDRVLPSFARSSGGKPGAGGLHLVGTDRLPRGIALLDAPDIDSVVETNRVLATQLLGAADSWLFVTTAARYADAVPWDLLEAARERGTSLSLVLDRAPQEAVDDIREHLVAMLDDRGLTDTPVLVIPETTLDAGRLPAAALAPVRAWFDDLAADAQAREGVVERTLSGALRSIPDRVRTVQEAITEQDRLRTELAAQVERSYDAAHEQVDETVRSGALLRGEVLARWHDVIGTGDLMRALETRIGRIRDRMRAFVTGATPAEVELKAAVVTGVDAVVIAAADQAAERAADAWRATPAGRSLLDRGRRLDAASPGLADRTAQEVRAWQGEVLELVREEGAGKRATARLASFGINATGLTVMIAVFASTGGLTGTEVVVAGGTSALGQKVLEAIFGDQAVRALAERARVRLMERVKDVLDTEAERYTAVLDAAAPPSVTGSELAAATAELGAAG